MSESGDGGREGEKRVHAWVPEPLHHLAKEDDRSIKELVIAGMESELGVTEEDSVAVIEREIARLEDELEREASQLETKRSRVQETRERLERKRELRESVESQTAAYEDDLDDLLDRMEAGEVGRLFTPHPELRELSTDHGRTQDEIHMDLQERAADQDRGLTVADFQDGYKASEADEETPIAEKWADGGEQ